MRNLLESLLDDEDILIQSMDKSVIKDWLAKYATGDYKCKYTKYGIELNKGTLIIKGFDGDKFPEGLTFIKSKGNLHIDSCPNITSLNNLFDDKWTIFDGNLHIDNCPKLKELGKLPIIVGGSLSIFGNKSLKSLEGLPEQVYRVTYIAKNGKKFSKEEIEKYIKTNFGRIDTISESFDEAYDNMINESEQQINEALNEPHLLKLAGWLRKKAKELQCRGFNFASCFRGNRIAWDKITSSDVETYVWPDIDEKIIKKCRLIISGKDRGFILLQNSKGDFTHVIFNDKKIAYLADHYYSSYSYGIEIRDVKSTELAQYCKNAHEITIIKYKEELDTADLQSSRMNSREGMVYNTPDYYKDIARENVRRYKQIIAKNKVLKVTDKDRFNKDVQDVVMKALQAATLVNSQPDKYADDIWRLDVLMREIYGEQRWAKGETVGEDGILVLYSEYSSTIAEVYNQKTYGSPESNISKLKRLEKDLESSIKAIKFNLAKFGL